MCHRTVSFGNLIQKYVGSTLPVVLYPIYTPNTRRTASVNFFTVNCYEPVTSCAAKTGTVISLRHSTSNIAY